MEDETDNCPSGNASAVGVSILPGIPYVLSILGVSNTIVSLALLAFILAMRMEIVKFIEINSRDLNNQITFFLAIFALTSSEPYFLFLDL